MKLGDIIDIAITNIRHQKLRSWLTILGIVIGVAAIITLISVSLGMQHNISQRTSALGANIITISPGGQRAERMAGIGIPGAGRPPASGGFGGSESSDAVITFKEADDLRTLPGVYSLDAELNQRAQVTYKNKNTSLTVIGTEPDAFPDVVSVGLEDGRYLTSSDKYSVVVGYNVAHNVFNDDNESIINKQIEISGMTFRVVGLLKESGGMAGSDNDVYIPQKTAQEIFDQPDDVSRIVVVAREDHNVDEVAATLSDELLSLHDLEGQDPDFQVITATSVQSAVSSITDTITLFLGGIASISLIVGGIGVLNTMFMSVLEQTRTIGVFKAIGAKDRDIIALFIIEAAILGFVGGFAGIALSLLASMALEAFSVPTLITAELVALGLVFSIIVGIVAGIAPARNAASISPIEALRYE